MTKGLAIRVILIMSAILMVVGHFAVMTSGASYTRDVSYNPFQHWVSDFAAVWPQGLYIKVSIILFGIALGVFYKQSMEAFYPVEHASRGWDVLPKIAWIILAIATIGGLFLVATFDLSPVRYRETGFWLFKRIDEVPRTVVDWKMHWYHGLGFQLFAIGFFASCLWILVIEMIRKVWDRVPESLVVAILAFGLTVWTILEKSFLPGIPQRLLLCVIFYWVWRNAGFNRNLLRSHTLV